MHEESKVKEELVATEEKPQNTSSYSSPTSAVSEEETRILTEFNHQKNWFKLVNLYEPHRMTLTLKKFFKSKRNQQIVISSRSTEGETVTTEGKVDTIGRDFVMLTNLKKRIWIPYAAIESANIPFGFPTYSNTQQYHLYDNQLQQKLTQRFGETVAKRDELVKQFFEESLQTNLSSWIGVWVEVKTETGSTLGKLTLTTVDGVTVNYFKTEKVIPLSAIRSVQTVDLVSIWIKVTKSMLGLNKEKVIKFS